jgi:uncharacterized membrane protein (UPF0127 family)
MKRVFLSVLALAVILIGCGKSPAPTPSTAPVATAAIPPEPTQAQPKLQTIRLWLGTEELTAEMALSPVQRQTGLMFRTNMDEMDGMIFVFPSPYQVGFWMLNCPLPLSCAYITPNGAIAEIHDLHSYDTNAVVATATDIQYVLEVNQGWFGRHHIATGTIVKTERGTLQETFFRGSR